MSAIEKLEALNSLIKNKYSKVHSDNENNLSPFNLKF